MRNNNTKRQHNVCMYWQGIEEESYNRDKMDTSCVYGLELESAWVGVVLVAMNEVAAWRIEDGVKGIKGS